MPQQHDINDKNHINDKNVHVVVNTWFYPVSTCRLRKQSITYTCMYVIKSLEA